MNQVHGKNDPKQKYRLEIRELANQATEAAHQNRDLALERAIKAEAIAREHFGPESPEMVWAEFALGHVFLNNRDSKGSIPHLEHCMALARKYPNNPCMKAEYIEIWLYKGYNRSGNADKAEALIANTINKLEKDGDYKKMLDYVMQYAKGGHCKQAVALMDRTVKLCEKNGVKMMPILKQQYTVYLRCRKYPQAITCMERRKELQKESSDLIGYADTIRELGQLCDLAEKFDKAGRYYEEAIGLYKKQKRENHEVARLMQDYARVLEQLNRTKEAQEMKKAATDLQLSK